MLVVVRKERKLIVMQVHDIEYTHSSLTVSWLENWVRADFASLEINSLIITAGVSRSKKLGSQVQGEAE